MNKPSGLSKFKISLLKTHNYKYLNIFTPLLIQFHIMHFQCRHCTCRSARPREVGHPTMKVNRLQRYLIILIRAYTTIIYKNIGKKLMSRSLHCEKRSLEFVRRGVDDICILRAYENTVILVIHIQIRICRKIYTMLFFVVFVFSLFSFVLYR